MHEPTRLPEIKRAATGRWLEVLSHLGGIDESILDGKHHPCPRCGGKDRFRVINKSAGALLCNQCFRSKNGDGIAALGWLNGWDFPTTLRQLAGYLGIENGGVRHQTDLIGEVARLKRVPAAALKAYGAHVANRGELRVVRFPVVNERGEPHSHFDLSVDGGKGWFAKGKGKSGLFLPMDDGSARLPKRGETWVVVEGPKDAAALQAIGYLAVGLPRSELPMRFVQLFRGVQVIVVPDRDRAGEHGADKTCARLHGVAECVLRATLPTEFRESGGADVRDVLMAKDGDEQLRQAIKDAHPWEQRVAADPTLPVIDASVRELKIITSQAWEAIIAANNPQRIFRHAGAPARIEADDEGVPFVRQLTTERLRYELARAANWQLKSQKETKLVQPPTLVVEDVLATPDQPLPILRRIVEAPVFAPDGTLHTEPGYCAASQTYLVGSLQLPEILKNPSREEVRVARELYLSDLMGDFPFVAEPDKAHALALALLPYVRDMIPGPTPLHLFEAPEAGTGKGLLADVLLRPSMGRQVSVTVEARDNDEWRKRITATLCEGRSAILIDNVSCPLDSGVLAAALTATSWDDRYLGKTKNVRVASRCVWAATANNPVLSTEIARRCVRIRMDSKQDRPWLREGFRHKNLSQWTQENRAKLVWAALVMIRAWLAAGQPKPPRHLGSFDKWAETIGGILDVVGVPGFLANLSEFYEQADREGAVWRELVERWWEKFEEQPVGTKELFPIAEEMDNFDLGRGQERSQRTTFGKRLAKQRDRVIGKYRIVSLGTRQGASRWALQSSTKGEHGEQE